MVSPLAGAWLPFHLAACVLLLKESPKKNAVWYACLAWLLTLVIATFFIAPLLPNYFTNPAATFWALSAMPIMGLCVTKTHLKPYTICFGTVLVLYAAGLIVQMLAGVQYTTYNVEGYAWPLLDPNNAAAVLNIALIPCLWLALRDYRWNDLVFVFAGAMIVTLSKAGMLVAAAVYGILLIERYGRKMLLATLLLIAALFPFQFAWDIGFNIFDKAIYSLNDRLPIWRASLHMLVLPFTGLGIGSFGHYYQQVRTETYTAGWYAHNDALQFAIELGIPAALVFCGLVVTVIATTRKHNIAPACAMLAVLLMALVEFQFYLPVISLLMGLALAWHIYGVTPPKQRSWIDQ